MGAIGFLLGARRYVATQAWFPDGTHLVVSVKLVYRDDEIGMFDCTIRSDAMIFATAQSIIAERKELAQATGAEGGNE